MPEPSKIEVEKFTRTDDLPTEEEINEWTQKSRKEGLCGLIDRHNKPTKRCKKCKNYYCSKHFPPHLDLPPDNKVINMVSLAIFLIWQDRTYFSVQSYHILSPSN